MPISKQTLDFLAENRLRNSREWYLEHKPQYQEYVFEPLAELVCQLAPTMAQIDPLLVTTPKTDKTISRIYRDTRFSHDKSLYRDVMWVVFARSRKEFSDMPGFVLEFSPQGFRYGCGYFQAPTKIMEMVRKLILEKDKSFSKAFRTINQQNHFTMEGEFYKRSKCPDAPLELRNWLDRKNIDWMHNSTDANILFSTHLYQTLAEGFSLLQPCYEFLCQARDLAFH